MKKTLQLLLFLLIFLLIFIPYHSKAGENDISRDLTKGKWINRSAGYVPSPTTSPDELSPDEKKNLRKRLKTFEFNNNHTFLLDSAKQRYTGKWEIRDNEVYLSFNEATLTHLKKNTDPNNLSAGYNTKSESIRLPGRNLTIKEGHLTGDGFTYKNYPGSVSGLLNFLEFSGFANVTWGHIVMMVVGLFFLFLAIRYNFEPLLLVPIGIGIL
ncbi:MAG: hypothetical protein JXR31_11125, partial [Prolixibacteraceae bacterium]|nr:hypothetical protein [Prolixibacteraceae bacterium]